MLSPCENFDSSTVEETAETPEEFLLFNCSTSVNPNPHVKNHTNMIVYGSNLHKGLNVLNIKVSTSNNRDVLFGVPLKRERTCVYVRSVPQRVVELQWIIKPSEILLLISVLHVHRKRGDN